MLIASAKNPGPKFPRFQLPLNKTSCPTYHLSFTDDSRTAKEQKLTKQFFLLSHIGFPHKVHSISIEKQVSSPS